MLSSSLVAHMKAQQVSISVIYFFCDEGDPAKRTPIGVLRSLIAQLVAGNTDLVQLAREVIIKSGQEKSTSFLELLDLFKAMITHRSHPIFVIIDALDECESGRESTLLQQLAELSANHQFHLSVFSRSEPWLRIALSTWSSLEITSNVIEQDMTLYIRKVVQRSPLSNFLDNTMSHRITQALISKADGQFLWTRLMVESLEKATCLSEINQILNNVPRGLSQLYGRILEKLLAENHRRQRTAQLLLNWLACAERHLTVSELATALAIRPGASEIDPDDRVLDLTGFLEDIFGSLVKISEPSEDRAERVVSFVHLTVKEYLLVSEEPCSSQQIPVAKFRVVKSEANQHLGSICITYLNFKEWKDRSKIIASCPAPTNPSSDLLEYAAMFWVRHLAQSGAPTMDLLRRLHLFLQSDQLLAYIERCVAVNNAGFSVSNLLVSQKLLNDWIGNCVFQDPRLALVVDCFRLRLEEVVQRRTMDFGADHPETLETKFQLAQLLHYRGEWTQSAVLHREVLDGRIRTLGEQYQVTLNSMFCLPLS